MMKMHSSNPRRAFTLIELIVVIGIILLLVALTAAVSTALVTRAEVQRTESTLSLLDQALEDWRVTIDRSMSWGTDGTPAGATYDLHINTPHVVMVTEMLRTVGRTPTAKEILAQIPEKQVLRYDTANPPGSGTSWLSPGDPDDPDPNVGGWTLADFVTGDLVIMDAWGTPIRMIHPGRLINAVPSVTDPQPTSWPAWITEQDGTVYVEDGNGFNGLEEYYGVARNRKVCFVSAGPDGKFGSVTAAVGTKLHDQTLDNIYSYEVIKP